MYTHCCNHVLNSVISTSSQLPVIRNAMATMSDICVFLSRSAQHVSIFQELPSFHRTVIGFALDWESRKSLKHDRECLTELLERACYRESDNKGFEWKRGWVVWIKSCATFSVLFDGKTTTVEQITLFQLICSKNDSSIDLILSLWANCT